jgi:hypothetical protein
MNNSEKLVLIVALFTVVIGIFTSVASYAIQADISTWPTWAQPLLRDFLLFLGSTPAIFALAFFRNILGFLYNWIANHQTASVTYDFDRTLKTIALYLSFAGPITAAVPAPYNTLALPVTFILDLAVSQINKIINPTATQPPAQTTPPALYSSEVTPAPAQVPGLGPGIVQLKDGTYAVGESTPNYKVFRLPSDAQAYYTNIVFPALQAQAGPGKIAQAG